MTAKLNVKHFHLFQPLSAMHLLLQCLVAYRRPHASLRVGLVRNAPLRAKMVILWRVRQLECVSTVEIGLEKTT